MTPKGKPSEREQLLLNDALAHIRTAVGNAALVNAAPVEAEEARKAQEAAVKERKGLQEKGIPFEKWDGPAIREEIRAYQRLWDKGGAESTEAEKRLHHWIETPQGKRFLEKAASALKDRYDGKESDHLGKLKQEIIRRFIPSPSSPFSPADYRFICADRKSCMVTRTMKPYKPDELDISPGPFGRSYKVTILDPEGKVFFHPVLRGLEPEAPEGSIQQAILQKMPDAYAQKILDLCIDLALRDQFGRKSGKFWWHPNLANLAFGLKGRKDSRLGGANARERKRYKERFDRLASTKVEIRRTTRQGIEDVWTGYLITRDIGERKLDDKRPGRPTILHRYEVNEILFEEAKEHKLKVPPELFMLPAGPVYKLARYAFVRNRMAQKVGRVPPESLENVAIYAGLREPEVERALLDLPRYKVPGLTVKQGRRGLIAMEYTPPAGLLKAPGSPS